MWEELKFVRDCRKSFAKAHGMSDWKARLYFFAFNVNRELYEGRGVIGHHGYDPVLIAHNIIEMSGGYLPEMKTDYSRR